MAASSTLQQAIATIEDIGQRYRDKPELPNHEWRRDQVANRRVLLSVIADIDAAGRSLLSVRDDQAQLREFEECVARFRHVLTLHQARWPAVSIDLDDVDYLRSRQNLLLAIQKLTNMINGLLT